MGCLFAVAALEGSNGTGAAVGQECMPNRPGTSERWRQHWRQWHGVAQCCPNAALLIKTKPTGRCAAAAHLCGLPGRHVCREDEHDVVYVCYCWVRELTTARQHLLHHACKEKLASCICTIACPPGSIGHKKIAHNVKVPGDCGTAWAAARVGSACSSCAICNGLPYAPLISSTTTS
jgi:hypothetical protein